MSACSFIPLITFYWVLKQCYLKDTKGCAESFHLNCVYRLLALLYILYRCCRLVNWRVCMLLLHILVRHKRLLRQMLICLAENVRGICFKWLYTPQNAGSTECVHFMKMWLLPDVCRFQLRLSKEYMLSILIKLNVSRWNNITYS